MTSIFISGAGGVGKTTLLEALADHPAYRAKFRDHAQIAEVARKVIAARDLKQADMNANKDDIFWKLQGWIAIAQQQEEQAAIKQGRPIFSDRCGLD